MSRNYTTVSKFTVANYAGY